MCVIRINGGKCKMINRNKLGQVVGGVLTQAKLEGRLICGLFPAITYLEKALDDVVLCVLPETRPGDSASHMQTVLLQAFCYENYIPVIKVDSSEKLANYCGLSSSNKKDRMNECSCALITKDMTTINSDDELILSPKEQVLTHFYECTLEEFPRPIIQLPI